MSRPAPVFQHLSRLSTPLGLFEHALFSAARLDHGYCLDDVARGLVVTAREPDPTDEVRALSASYLRFTVDAQDSHGRFRNRRAADGAWQGDATVEDHWGRALWGLGTSAAACTDDHTRDLALRGAALGFCLRSPWPRATAYASLGAAEVLRVCPEDREARSFLTDARTTLARPTVHATWPWPEARLTYANAVLPEALLAIGVALQDDVALRDGLALLSWLVEQETRDDHISVTPAGGWSLGAPRPGFDQQPIEVAALAEACWRAFEVTRDARWAAIVEQCVAWFLGANDVGLVMYDPSTGGGYDGLHRAAVNLNQGAESTLAALSTFQLGRLVPADSVH